MQQSAPNRKRPAPGASPLAQSMPAPQPWMDPPHIVDYSNPDFNFNVADGNSFDFDANSVFGAQQQQQPPAYQPITTNTANAHANSNLPVQSTEIVRRPRNTQLTQQHLLPPYPANMNGHGSSEDTDDEPPEVIEAKIAQAKKGDGTGKRKDIPPFVKKLSNFLNQEDRTNLIRWSDDGKSFIVLDEDEFARTMIPELFKHNNYASFVRQLNMYGFHKAVDIKDGSLQQSEQARSSKKPPSTYKHRYFRRNEPDLLWLITKPNAKANSKRPKREGKDGYDSDEERYNSPVPEGRPQAGLGPAGGNQDVMALPRNELNSLKQELAKLQNQQTMISSMINKLKMQNDQFYRQASHFQSLHDRHENSINAILTFLATFYNRSLEDHDGQNLVNMFSNASQNTQHQQGGVVEEFSESTPDNTNNQLQRYVKRPQLLITNSQDSPSPGFLHPRSSATPNSARHSASPPESNKSASATPIPQSRSITNDAAPDVISNNDQLTSQFQGINQSHGHPSQLSGGNREQLMEVLNSVSSGQSGGPQAMQDMVASNEHAIRALQDQQMRIGEGIENAQSKVERFRNVLTPPLVSAPSGENLDFGFSAGPFDGGGGGGDQYFDFNADGEAAGGDFFAPNGSAQPDFAELLNESGDGSYGDFGLDFNDDGKGGLGDVFGGKVESLNSSSAASPAVQQGGEGFEGEAQQPDRKRMRTG